MVAICFLPVHDNYLHNKISAAATGCAQGDAEGHAAPPVVFPMEERCQMIQALLSSSPTMAKSEPHQEHEEVLELVLDYERRYAAELLEEASTYWAARLPAGYLLTTSTAHLVKHFATHSPLLAQQGGAQGGARTRLAVVLGADAFIGMGEWTRPADVLEHADLVLMARGKPVPQRPRAQTDKLTQLLSARVRFFETSVPMSLVIGHSAAFAGGDDAGSFVNPLAASDCALFAVPPLDAGDEELSSSAICAALHECYNVLIKHGVPRQSLGLLLQRAALGGEAVLALIGESARERGEFVRPKQPHNSTQGSSLGLNTFDADIHY